MIPATVNGRGAGTVHRSGLTRLHDQVEVVSAFDQLVIGAGDVSVFASDQTQLEVQRP